MALAKRDEGSKVNSDINVTPMVDVMLVLLIIFMVVTPMLQKGASVDMAKTDNPAPMQDADKEDAVIVAVQKDYHRSQLNADGGCDSGAAHYFHGGKCDSVPPRGWG